MKINVPTKLSKEQNQAFRDLYFKHFGETLTVEEAEQQAWRLLSFYAVIIGYRESRKN